MAIYLNEWNAARSFPQCNVVGGYAQLYADTKAEIAAEDEVVATANSGDVTCLAGSACITKIGEVLLLDSAGSWAEI